MRLKSPFSPSEAEARWLRSSFGRRFNSLSDNFNRFSFGCIHRCFGFGQLGSTLFSTLLGLFAGFSLLRIIPGSTFLHAGGIQERSEEHTSELQSLMRISYAVFCLKKKQSIS